MIGKRKHESGNSKRKNKARENQLTQSLAGSMNRYVKPVNVLENLGENVTVSKNLPKDHVDENLDDVIVDENLSENLVDENQNYVNADENLPENDMDENPNDMNVNIFSETIVDENLDNLVDP